MCMKVNQKKRKTDRTLFINLPQKLNHIVKRKAKKLQGDQVWTNPQILHFLSETTALPINPACMTTLMN